MIIDEITEKIIESRNNDIAKAFTMQIGSLLLNNGIVPIMTEYTRNDVKNITDTDTYKLVMEYGIAFKDLDCTEHDKEIYNKAIDDYMNKLCNHCMKEANECNKLECPFCTDGCDIVKIAEQLKAGEENE